MTDTDRRGLTARVEVPYAHDTMAWEWAISMPYRCRADPAQGLVMPASPTSMLEDEDWERRFKQQLAYYTSLHSFLTYSFGWTRHDKGLLWWYEAGWPTADPRLALLKDIWFDDDTLTGYLAWATTIDPSLIASPLRRWAKQLDVRPVQVPQRWVDEFRSALSEGVWAGGSDPMHLSGGWHGAAASGVVEAGASDSPPARMHGVDVQSRSATFVAEEVRDWYTNLTDLGERLPPLDGVLNWHVDVFVKPIGYLGVYRRSRQTGLWFSGQHRYHSVGN